MDTKFSKALMKFLRMLPRWCKYIPHLTWLLLGIPGSWADTEAAAIPETEALLPLMCDITELWTVEKYSDLCLSPPHPSPSRYSLTPAGSQLIGACKEKHTVLQYTAWQFKGDKCSENKKALDLGKKTGCCCCCWDRCWPNPVLQLLTQTALLSGGCLCLSDFCAGLWVTWPYL